jgi:hypothetical protein
MLLTYLKVKEKYKVFFVFLLDKTRIMLKTTPSILR